MQKTVILVDVFKQMNKIINKNNMTYKEESYVLDTLKEIQKLLEVLKLNN